MIRQFIFVIFLAAFCAVGFSTLHAADNPESKPATPEQAADKGIKAIGIILVNAEDASKVILLTKAPDPQNPQGRMLGIPVLLDDNGKKIVNEYGISGLRPNEDNGMERIQKEADDKVVFVNGVIKNQDGTDMLAITDYIPAAEYMKQVEEIQKAAAKQIQEEAPKK